MHTHKPHDSDHQEPEVIDVSKGYETTDTRVSGVVVFIVSMAAFLVVVAGAAFGIGMLLNRHMAKEDGPKNKWAEPVDVRPLGNLPSNPALENKLGELAQRFPSPRIQSDDGLQDLADLHAREDVLLNNNSWVDQSQGKVRIPIERAMELVAQRGLPVAPAVDHAPLMTGDYEPKVTAPLTNGFVRTGYEQEQSQAVDKTRTK